MVFQNSESVKRALKEYIPDYKETKNVFSTIENNTDNAIRISKELEQRGTSSNKYDLNPHTDIYKVVEDIKNM